MSVNSNDISASSYIVMLVSYITKYHAVTLHL